MNYSQVLLLGGRERFPELWENTIPKHHPKHHPKAPSQSTISTIPWQLCTFHSPRCAVEKEQRWAGWVAAGAELCQPRVPPPSCPNLPDRKPLRAEAQSQVAGCWTGVTPGPGGGCACSARWGSFACKAVSVLPANPGAALARSFQGRWLWGPCAQTAGTTHPQPTGTAGWEETGVEGGRGGEQHFLSPLQIEL